MNAAEVQTLIQNGLPGAQVRVESDDDTHFEAVIVAPSNPLVSIGPILAVPGIREALVATDASVVAVSPIIGGKALKGPADKMLASLGHESSAVGVARVYADFLDVLVIDNEDAALASEVESAGVRAAVTDTIMRNLEIKERLASETIAAVAGQ